MILRVSPNVPIPYTIKTGYEKYATFDPDGEIDDARGAALLKSRPNVFSVPDGKADLKKYKKRRGSAVAVVPGKEKKAKKVTKSVPPAESRLAG